MVGLSPIITVSIYIFSPSQSTSRAFVTFDHKLFDTLHTATTLRNSLTVLIQSDLITFGSSFLISHTIHIWNDSIDVPLKKLLERNYKRSIPYRAESPFIATIFTYTQPTHAVLFLLCLLSFALEAFYTLSPAWLARHTSLKVTDELFASSTIILSCLGYRYGINNKWSRAIHNRFHGLGLKTYLKSCFFLAKTLWLMIININYLHSALDDSRAGIKSLTVLYHDYIEMLLW